MALQLCVQLKKLENEITHQSIQPYHGEEGKEEERKKWKIACEKKTFKMDGHRAHNELFCLLEQ